MKLSWPERELGGKMPGGRPWDVRIPMQDFKSLRVAFVICVTLVNTHTHTERQGERGRERKRGERLSIGYTISSASWAKTRILTCTHY